MSRKKNEPPSIVAAREITGSGSIAPSIKVITDKPPVDAVPVLDAGNPLRVVSRRALARGAVRLDTDHPDRAQFLGQLFTRAHVVCTVGDIGDPTFRLWLSEHVATRLDKGARFTLEIV